MVVFGEHNVPDFSTSFGFILAHLLTLAPVYHGTVDGWHSETILASPHRIP